MRHTINTVVDELKINEHSNTQIPVSNPPQSYAYADTGASDNYVTTKAPLINKKINPHHIKIGLPNGQPLQSTHIGNIQLNVPHDARQTHVIPGLKHNLVSIGKLCDEGCGAWFEKDKVTIYNAEGKELLHGPQDHATKLWKLNIGETEMCNNIHQLKNVQNMVQFVYEALFCPALSTLQHAIKNNFLSAFPYINDPKSF